MYVVVLKKACTYINFYPEKNVIANFAQNLLFQFI